ncbi:MAG: sulfotransferase family 2 domain-containing protein [Rhizomicrobium sp.]
MMVVSHSRAFVFAHIPKTAGTSIAAALAPFADGQRAAHGGTGHETLGAFLARRPDLRGHFKFAFVRNPWERAVSFYFHARQRLAPTLPQMQAVENFEDMLQLIDRGTAWIADLLSLRPQSGFLHADDGTPLADFIGRYEKLDADFAAACRRAGIVARLARANPSRHGHYASYFSDWGKGFVADRYREDIAAFDYRFEAAP